MKTPFSSLISTTFSAERNNGGVFPIVKSPQLAMISYSLSFCSNASSSSICETIYSLIWSVYGRSSKLRSDILATMEQASVFSWSPNSTLITLQRSSPSTVMRWSCITSLIEMLIPPILYLSCPSPHTSMMISSQSYPISISLSSMTYLVASGFTSNSQTGSC